MDDYLPLFYAAAASAIVFALVAFLSVLFGRDCPKCGSARVECQGEWDGWEFMRCRACQHCWEVRYRKGK